MMRRGERNDGVKSYSENILALVCPLSLRTTSPRLNFVRISQGQAAGRRNGLNVAKNSFRVAPLGNG